MKMVKVFLSVLVLSVISGCIYTDSRSNDGYDSGYEKGYEDGFSDGESEGRNEAFEELENYGVIKLEEFVFLPNDGSSTYHGRYCELSDWDRQVPLQTAIEWGYAPCNECGGYADSAYTNATDEQLYDNGYSDGFQSAVDFILGRMEPIYREKWWAENIDDITDIGFGYSDS